LKSLSHNEKFIAQDFPSHKRNQVFKPGSFMTKYFYRFILPILIVGVFTPPVRTVMMQRQYYLFLSPSFQFL
jgi:hypothetical protein